MKTRLASECLLLIALMTASCSTPASSAPTSTKVPVQTEPFISVTVAAALQPGGVQVPGGPGIIVTLKNNSTEPIVALSAFLSINSVSGSAYTFDFGISAEKPLQPDISISKTQILIGGGYGSDIPYPLGIAGTFKSGRTFTQENFVLINTTVTLPTTTAPGAFSFTFKYGVNPEQFNELDTVHGIFRKDMVSAPPVSAALVLTKSEMDAIYLKMQEIGFWSYPDIFQVPTGATVAVVTPSEKFFFRVELGTWVKELYWDNKFLSNDPQAAKLKSLIQLIKDIVFAKPEYQGLPPASGGYL
jgi:hypothetical protein